MRRGGFVLFCAVLVGCNLCAMYSSTAFLCSFNMLLVLQRRGATATATARVACRYNYLFFIQFNLRRPYLFGY